MNTKQIDDYAFDCAFDIINLTNFGKYGKFDRIGSRRQSNKRNLVLKRQI
jgi:hypothetical protein